MSLVVFFSLSYAFLQGVLNFGMKKFTKNSAGNYEFYAVIFYVVSAILVGVFSLLYGERILVDISIFKPYILNIFLVVILNGVGIINVFSSFRKVEASVFTILFSSNVVFTLLSSYFFLKESLEWSQYLGVFFVIFAIIIVTYRKGGFEIKFNNGVIILLASFCMGVAITNTKYLFLSLPELTPFSYLIISSCSTAIFILIVKFKKILIGIKELRNINFIKWMSFLSFVHALMLFALYKALSFVESNSMQVAGIMSSSVLFGVLLSFIFLKERSFWVRKILAVMIVFLGIWLIS